MQTLIVIPARHASKRFPAKPLHPIAGVSLLERVWRIAEAVADGRRDVEAVIATDHADILAHAADFGGRVVMTDPALPSGSDRALAAARLVAQRPDFVVNLQGDAPFTPPGQVEALIAAAEATGAPVVTPVVRLSWEALDEVRRQKLAQPFSGTSCVRGADGRAFWFSKMVLPAIRDEAKMRAASPLSPVFRHIGLYGYTLEALELFTSAPVGHHEALEGLEQLRFLENGVAIQTIEVEPSTLSMWGVDTREDAAYAERLIAEHGDPLEALKR